MRKSFECLYYSSSLKEEHKKIIPLVDYFCSHLTLISLAHYNNQNEQVINSLAQSMNVFNNVIDDEPKSVKNESYLDFMILLDALFEVLCNDDSDLATSSTFCHHNDRNK